MTLIVNLFAGPGAGKSTIRAGVFHLLKSQGYNVEEVTEYAKDLTWENNKDVLKVQPHIFGEQLKRVDRLIGKVDAVITDAPILLSVVYGNRYFKGVYPPSFYQSVREIFKSYNNLNFFIERGVRPYNPSGRNESKGIARSLDNDIRWVLQVNDIPYHHLNVLDEAAFTITKLIKFKLNEER